jgi:hypothetical protein
VYGGNSPHDELREAQLGEGLVNAAQLALDDSFRTARDHFLFAVSENLDLELKKTSEGIKGIHVEEKISHCKTFLLVRSEGRGFCSRLASPERDLICLSVCLYRN